MTHVFLWSRASADRGSVSSSPSPSDCVQHRAPRRCPSHVLLNAPIRLLLEHPATEKERDVDVAIFSAPAWCRRGGGLARICSPAPLARCPARPPIFCQPHFLQGWQKSPVTASWGWQKYFCRPTTLGTSGTPQVPTLATLAPNSPQRRRIRPTRSLSTSSLSTPTPAGLADLRRA